MTITGRNRRVLLQATSAAAAIALAIVAQQAQAQEQAQVRDQATPQPDQATPQAVPQTAATEAPAGDILVTGTRVRRAGYSAATPTTVLNADQLDRLAKPNIADAINLLPSLSASQTPNTSQPLGGSTAGMNLLNLRGLGVNRTLVLMNGRRVLASTVNGNVDINTLPTQLVQRVDIVTGGASATYGSGAVAGVVNFVLDTNFNGVQGSLQSGITERGDGSNQKVELAAGTSLFGGRGHIEAAGSYSRSAAVEPANGRSWYRAYKLVTNPTNSAQRIIISGNSASQTTGGLISTGPLRGTQFLAGGAPAPFNFGTVISGVSTGGDSQDLDGLGVLQAPVDRASAFGRLSFDLTPSITLFGEAYYAQSHALSRSGPYGSNSTIQADNAFLDGATAARLAAAGATSFVLGRNNIDIGEVVWDNRVKNYNLLGGLKGRFGSTFTYDAYYQYGASDQTGLTLNNTLVKRFALAVDAVRAPAGNALGVPTGTIVCRSSLTDTANGCAPLNLFGYGSPSAAAKNYVLATGSRPIHTTQEEAGLNIQGEPFSNWAGPVSVALGAEYRRESYDAGSSANDIAGNFYLGNSPVASGSFHSKEAYLETVFPLLSGLSFAKELDFNGAVRFTDYSFSGKVTTWKLGATWDITDEYRLRGVRSTDIRAPNLNDLFSTGSTLVTNITDPTLPAGSAPYTTSQVTSGNRGLVPEVARTWSGGGVWRPNFVKGFQLSVDYYNIKINNAILTVQSQLLVNQCFAGITVLCASIVRDPATNLITRVNVGGQNVQSESTSGIDIETSYHKPLVNGAFDLRLLATHVFSRKVVGLAGTTNEYANTSSDTTAVPSWRGLASANLSLGSFDGLLTARYIGSGVLTYQLPVIVGNRVPAVTYLDLAIAEHIGRHATVAFNVDNLLDKDPPAAVSTQAPVSGSPFGTNLRVYDVLGRQYRVTFRFRY